MLVPSSALAPYRAQAAKAIAKYTVRAGYIQSALMARARGSLPFVPGFIRRLPLWPFVGALGGMVMVSAFGVLAALGLLGLRARRSGRSSRGRRWYQLR